MASNLRRYLNDHMAGASAAIDLIAKLADADDDPHRSDFFCDLKTKVEGDRELLKTLLENIGQSESGIVQIVGSLTEKAGRLKWMWEGLKPGHLGMFEALEVLCLGIQGKRLLWAVLARIAPRVPQWSEVDFMALERQALTQRDAVENLRIAAGIHALLETDP